MTIEEKLAALEDIMELDAGALKPDMALEDIEEWDSLTALSFLELARDGLGRQVDVEAIRAFRTVQDMLDALGG